MKKISSLTVITLLVSAATTFSQAKVALTGGVSFSNIFSKEEGNTTKLNNRTGITGGMQVDIPAGNHLSIQTGLNFVQKGAHDKSNIMGEQFKYNLNLNQLEVPLNVLYNSNHKTGNFFIGAGPAIGYNFSGDYSLEYGMMKEEGKLHFGNDPEKIKRIDAGANVTTGYRFANGIFMSVNYNRGLSNLSNESYTGYEEKVTTQYFGVRLGYQFGNKK